jgi:predicted nuclease of predicted toxin-antitoxin system
MRFVLDENVHRGLLPYLASIGHDVVLCPKGLTNGKVAEFAISDDRILITHDQDFSRLKLPEKHAGIVLVRIPSRNLDALKRSMVKLLLAISAPEQFSKRRLVLLENHYEDLPPIPFEIPFS